MKKKTAAITMAMVIAAIPAGAYAQDTANLTAEQLFADAMSYAIEAPQMTGTMSFSGEGSMKISGEGSPESSFGMAAGGDLEIKKTADPLKLQMTGNINAGLLGQSINADMDMYAIESEDGKTIDTYVKMISNGAESPWDHDSDDFEGIWEEMDVSGPDEFKEKMTEALGKVQLKTDWDIQEQGDTCVMSGQFTYADILPIIEESEEDMTEEERQMAEDILECLKVNVNCTFAKDTHALLKADINLDDSDMDTLGKTISDLIVQSMQESGATGSAMNLAFELGACGYSVEFNYDSAAEITVPEEALASARQDEVSVEMPENTETEADIQ